MILCTKLHYYYRASVAQFTQSEAKGTLVLQKFYSTIIGIACPELRLEIQMIVFATIRIEGSLAIWTVISWSHIFTDSQFSFTNPAKNCLRIPFIFIPNPGWMSSCFFMTLITGIVFVTTFEFYGNNIKRRMIMFATGFIINKLSIYFDHIHFAAKVRNDLRKKKFL